MRHFRAGVGVFFMTFGAAVGAANAYVDMRNELAGKSAVSSVMEFATEYGFPVLLFLAGLLLFQKDAFIDIIQALKGFLPGKQQ